MASTLLALLLFQTFASIAATSAAEATTPSRATHPKIASHQTHAVRLEALIEENDLRITIQEPKLVSTYGVCSYNDNRIAKRRNLNPITAMTIAQPSIYPAEEHFHRTVPEQNYLTKRTDSPAWLPTVIVVCIPVGLFILAAIIAQIKGLVDRVRHRP